MELEEKRNEGLLVWVVENQLQKLRWSYSLHNQICLCKLALQTPNPHHQVVGGEVQTKKRRQTWIWGSGKELWTPETHLSHPTRSPTSRYRIQPAFLMISTQTPTELTISITKITSASKMAIMVTLMVSFSMPSRKTSF